MLRVKKPSKPKRKTQSRARSRTKGANASSGESAGRAPAKHAQRKSASARVARRTPRHAGSGARKSTLSRGVYTGEDRGTLVLLLAPFSILTLGLGAIQTFTPPGTARSQFAVLPELQTAVALPAQPLDVAPRPRATVGGRTPALVRAASEAKPKNTITPDRALFALPPRETVVAKPEWSVHADRCIAPPRRAQAAQSKPVVASDVAAFGRMLARAARAQTEDLVIYTEKYRQIGFPMGDVPSLYGVCTDVVVRAYRALGIDLQVLVHKARIGTGDPSIDHRRTKTLRRFFARHGTSLPVTDFADNYKPGDIVTYYRAGGRTSQSHIAIVSDVIAPSGRPMIVHNRGWGPQLEDALFASEVTGHYRFTHTATMAAKLPTAEPAGSDAARLAQTPFPGAARLR